MKCKYDNEEMIMLVSDEFMEVYQCSNCSSVCIVNIEVYNDCEWFRLVTTDGYHLGKGDNLVTFFSDGKELLNIKTDGDIIWNSPKGIITIENKKMLSIAFLAVIIKLTGVPYDWGNVDEETYEYYWKFVNEINCAIFKDEHEDTNSTEYKIKVMQAYVNGKEIEYQTNDDMKLNDWWNTIYKVPGVNMIWNWETCDYRIKQNN